MMEVEENLVDVKTSPCELELVCVADCGAAKVSWLTRRRSMPLSRIKTKMMICKNAVLIHKQEQVAVNRQPLQNAGRARTEAKEVQPALD